MTNLLPEGYSFITLPANPFDNSCEVKVCNRCGAMVGNTSAHDIWHSDG